MRASVAGLGCGGHSRLGQSTGRSESDSVAVVQRALDLGVTFLDTARAYGTEEIVGKAVSGRRDEVLISTKASVRGSDGPVGAAELRRSLEESLLALRTDRVEVLHLHGVPAALYDHCTKVLVPEMFRMRDEGKIRFLAISEAFGSDTAHSMLSSAVGDDVWDVMMVGFNLLNPSARHRVLRHTAAKHVGVLIMFAVRRLLADPERLTATVRELVSLEVIDRLGLDHDDPLSFLTESGSAQSIVEAAYRFARHEPGVHVVLTGTGDVAHLEENVASISKPPLPEDRLRKLNTLFGELDTVSGN